MKIGVVYGNYYRDISMGLLKGVHDEAEKKSCEVSDFAVPGAFEIPLKLRQLIGMKEFDGFVALGCIVKGETYHNELIANAVSKAIMDLTVNFEIPIGFGILSVMSAEQAFDRISQRNNKGSEAFRSMWAVLTNAN